MDSYDNNTIALLREYLAENKISGYNTCMGQYSTVSSKTSIIGQQMEYHQKPHINLDIKHEDFVPFEPPKWLWTRLGSPDDFPPELSEIPWNYSTLSGDIQSEYIKVQQQMEINTQQDIIYGPQIPKFIQPSLDLWVPLQFWFCRDIETSLPISAIPYGEKIFAINLASISELCYSVAGLIVTQINYTTNNIVKKPIYVRSQINSPSLFSEMYINSIYLDETIHDIVMEHAQTHLIKTFRYQKKDVRKTIPLDLNWPVETIYF